MEYDLLTFKGKVSIASAYFFCGLSIVDEPTINFCMKKEPQA
jgi:hypothetical protein